MLEEWMFVVVSACQRFLCDTADAPWSQIAVTVSDFVTSIPEPPSHGAALFLHLTVLDLAVRWAYDRHRQVRVRCREDRCLAPLLAELGSAWSRRAAPPLVLFEQWIHRCCEGLSPTHPDPIVPWVAHWIRTHPKDPLDVEGLARQFHVDAWRLRRDFQRTFRMSPRECHRLTRVELAEALMRQAGAKIHCVAEDAGWKSKKNVYRAFRRVRGSTPGSVKPAKR